MRTATPEDTGPPPVTVMDALKRNIVSLDVATDDSGVVLTLARTRSRNEPLSLAIPAGTTRLGFVTAGAIAEIGHETVISFSSSGKQLKFRQWVATNGFDGEGFTLTLPKDVMIVMPTDERAATVVTAGALNVDVSPGLIGFCLGGQHGHVVEGSIHVAQSSMYDGRKPNHARYAISYASMSIGEKASALATGPDVGAASPVAEASSSMPLMNAIRQRLVALDVTGGKATVRVTLRRTSAEKTDLSVTLPAGTTKLGFTSSGKIVQTGQSCTAKQHVLALSERVGTNDFDSDGFALTLPEPTTIVIPGDKDDATIVLDGALSVKVPSGFYGFPLAGHSGRIVDGTVHVGKNTVGGKEKVAYEITFGNMRIE